MKKLLSIIVPAYNMEQLLPKCLESLMIEDVGRLEVLVVNDGSSDGTGEIAHRFERKCPDIFKVIDKPNGNYGSCINVALGLATGAYVKILDADDTYDTSGLQSLVDFISRLLEAGSHPDAILSDFWVVNPKGEVISRNRCNLPEDCEFGLETIASNMTNVGLHSAAYRLKLLTDIGYRQLEGISYTDNEWMFEPMSYVKTARYFPHSVYKYLVGRSSQTVSFAMLRKNYRMLLALLEDMLKIYSRRKPDADDAALRYLDAYLDRYIESVYDCCLKVVALKEFDFAFDTVEKLLERYCPAKFKRICKREVLALRRCKRFRLPYLILVRGILLARQCISRLQA